MRIGEAARRAGTTTRALRFYESQGLLDADRSANGYREYDERDVRVVVEIRSLQAEGLSLEETRPFVECLRAGHDASDSCADSFEMYSHKLAEVDAQIERLQAIRAALLTRQAAAAARAIVGCRAPLDLNVDRERPSS
ncbi:MerR family transcriptional regulator [Nakamurella multipartita]|jgi:DNA-binding transcriptional MerR regulator|uniref:Transcriptional regulator, MerR family n=1 Tax=Nakamurella multipartita (strain ATCC 700099 / DSM 44233 / CIP 104796 / JCM 9543 / NBRC 105858 / Y-104) TaxID=479431 RepID=C8XAJ2_NAKMY|nr:MerR family transcriptional regulator [Nakamurella multipartita]ACV77357.1 transcriptional regulator, MerR family [Nakamurella multipartita DSM 44233]